ncbi:MAG TPA: alpha/beta hydrolase [Gemmataceae bacterium]|nr:alpha/beta hydrolase [Gemmataceae bacterium]
MLRLALSCLFLVAFVASAAEPTFINVWPGTPPGETKKLEPETDTATAKDIVGGRRIQKITNVIRPTLTIYRPEKDKNTGAAVIICPGGGHYILAYDHEGTEVAEFLAKNGITGIVLKYRVPFRDENKRWRAAVQDAQRSVRLVRDKAGEWGIDRKRIGILGFSAGGETAALTAILHEQPQYEAVDKADSASGRPDFAALIYPGGLLEKGNTKLRDYVKVDKDTPPMFLVHAFDDPVDARNSLILASELKAARVSCELHMYATGGHGYGMRNTGHPVNTWPERCMEWMVKQGYAKK